MKPAIKKRQEVSPAEIDQIISYYCIVHEENPRFKNQEDCKSYATDIAQGCQVDAIVDSSVNLRWCIKSKLKK